MRGLVHIGPAPQWTVSGPYPLIVSDVRHLLISWTEKTERQMSGSAGWQSGRGQEDRKSFDRQEECWEGGWLEE